MNRLVAGAIAGSALGACATLPLAISAAQAERPLRQREYRVVPYVLSENVQRIARDDQIWRRYDFPTVESYVDFLSLADQIAKRRFATQMERLEGRADIDEEYRVAFEILCFIPIPGKPPKYSEQLEPFRTRLATTMFTSEEARRALQRSVRPDAYEVRAEDLKTIKELTPAQFFNIGGQ